MATLGQARPYRDFLTPSLHKRFTDSSLYTFLVCYVISVWMGSLDHYLWSWFPIGPAGIRTLLLFIPALAVYILRVAEWHVGRRNTQTPWETFSKYALRQSTFITIACYAISAWFYCEVYIWTRSGKARLSMTDKGSINHGGSERITLNERPIYFRFMFMALATAQGVVHLWRDYSKIEVPALKPRSERETAAAVAPTLRPYQLVIEKLKPMALWSVVLAAFTAPIGSIFYFLGFRHLLWNYSYNVIKTFVSLNSRPTKPTGLPPFFSLVLMFITEAALLVFLWQCVNKAFDIYITQAPLKKDQPITSESKDPNGSLLSGLKSKRETVKAMALWELALITDRFAERRKTIFGELSRKKAPTYKQVTDICLAEIRALISRVSVGLDPTYRPENEDGKKKNPEPISLVPQIAQPLKEAPILGPGQAPRTRMEKFGALTADIAKTHSSPQNAQNAKAREYLKKGQEKFNQGAKEAESQFSTYFARLVRSAFGRPFRHSLRRTTALVITGAPYSRISLLCNAIAALSNLTVCSLKEDEYGQFQTVVPEIIRVFTTAIKKVDEYVGKLQPHWSDYKNAERSPAERKKNIPEAEQVRETLRDGLEKILRAFGEYLSGMEMTRLEIQDARKCASKGPEMAVAR